MSGLARAIVIMPQSQEIILWALIIFLAQD